MRAQLLSPRGTTRARQVSPSPCSVCLSSPDTADANGGHRPALSALCALSCCARRTRAPLAVDECKYRRYTLLHHITSQLGTDERGRKQTCVLSYYSVGLNNVAIMYVDPVSLSPTSSPTSPTRYPGISIDRKKQTQMQPKPIHPPTQILPQLTYDMYITYSTNIERSSTKINPRKEKHGKQDPQER